MKKKKIVLAVIMAAVCLVLMAMIIVIANIRADVEDSIHSMNSSQTGDTSIDDNTEDIPDDEEIARYLAATDSEGATYFFDTFNNLFEPDEGAWAGYIVDGEKYVWSDAAVTSSNSFGIYFEGDTVLGLNRIGTVSLKANTLYAFFYQTMQEDGSWGEYQHIVGDVFNVYVSENTEEVLVNGVYEPSATDNCYICLEGVGSAPPCWIRLYAFAGQKME